MLKQEAGLAKGSGEPNTNKVGTVTKAQIRKIVETKMKDSPGVFEVIGERLASFGIAGLRLEGVGHGSGNRALPFGARATFDSSTGRLVVEEAAVT